MTRVSTAAVILTTSGTAGTIALSRAKRARLAHCLEQRAWSGDRAEPSRLLERSTGRRCGAALGCLQRRQLAAIAERVVGRSARRAATPPRRGIAHRPEL